MVVLLFVMSDSDPRGKPNISIQRNFNQGWVVGRTTSKLDELQGKEVSITGHRSPMVLAVPSRPMHTDEAG